MQAKDLARALFVAVACTAAMPAFAVPSDQAIRDILVQRVDAARQATGIVVGIVGPSGRRIVAHGALSATDLRRPGGDTVFEIGSVSKIFTSLLLTEMAQRGEVATDEPLATLLPLGYAPAARTGVVVLANANTRVGIIDIGLHLLDGQMPLADAKPPRLAPSSLDPATAERLAGRYQWTPGGALVVTHEGGRLFLQAGSPRKFELLHDGDGPMLMKETLGSIGFDLPMSGGPARAVNVRVSGGEYRAWRVK